MNDFTDGEIDETLIEFPEYKGWGFWMCEISRYTLRVVFRKVQ